MSNANRYTQRVFTNQIGHKVTRIFYRCENCWSKIHKDYIPDLDCKTINVLDLLKKHR